MTVCEIPIEQTMFLGCSVLNFSCSLGFNEQPTEINVKLVEDKCASPAGYNKVYYDVTQAIIKKTWTDVDPGFSSFGPGQNETPKLGAPVYFRVGQFEFCGLLQSWIKENTKGDQNVYNVKLVSPVEVLQGCQLIVSDYSGPVQGFNLFNIYGFEEVFSYNKPAPSYTDVRFPNDGPIMGSYAGAFGGANTNKIGMTWNKVKESLQILTSNLTPVNLLGYDQYSQNGRICYHGAQSNAKFGLIPYDDINIQLGLVFGVSAELAYYSLDISEIPNVPDDYRIAGPDISLMSLISQVCNDFGFDFYIELVPTQNGSSVHKTIKIRTISRLLQPDLTIVQSFIDATPEVLDSSFGRELRNESTTNFLIGGQKQSLIQVTNGLPDPSIDPEETWLNNHFGLEPSVRDTIVPYFGMDTSGNAVVLHTISGTYLQNFHQVPNLYSNSCDYFINLELRSKYHWTILSQLLPVTIPVTICEMRRAEQGYDSWAFYSVSNNTALNYFVTGAGYSIDAVLGHNVNSKNMQARDLARLDSLEIIDQLAFELRTYQQIIADIYTQSKQTLMVRVPWVQARYEIDSTTIANTVADIGVAYTDEPCEGGWTEAETLLDLPNPSHYVDLMRLEDGQVRPFAQFDLPDTANIITITGANGRVTTVISGSVSQTSKSTAQFETEECFAIDRQLVGNLPDPGKIIYYAFTQDPLPVFLDRTNLVSPRVIIKFSNSLEFDSDTSALFNNNGWNFQLAAQQLQAQQNSATSGVESELMINLIAPQLREPDKVAIALKSNSFCYGPWKPDNILEAGPPGQIRIQKEEDLVPWIYGSFEALDDVGQQRADLYVTVMNQAEVGNITVFGLPTVPLGAEIASLNGLTSQFFPSNEHLIENRSLSFSTSSLTALNGSNSTFTVPSVNFGFWNGSFGPNITSISVSLEAPDNISTSYSFRTYTPKFGMLSKLNAQRLEHRYALENHRRVRARFLDEQRRVGQNYLRELRKLTSQINASNKDIRATAGTPHSVFVGELVPWSSGHIAFGGTEDNQFKRSIVATKDLIEVRNNMTNNSFNTKSIMSLDGLIRPISLSGDGGLPRFPVTAPSGRTNTAAAIPPFSGSGNNLEYNSNITSNYLNPYSNPVGFNYSELSSLHTGKAGHDIDIVGRSTISHFSGSGNSLVMPIHPSGYNSDNRADYSNDYRTFALRGPIIIQGWGYDTNGKPIPNSGDTELATSGGIFTSKGLTDKFLANFLRKPHTWPVAPLDVRFDRDRNVWTSVPPYEFVVATIGENISANGSGKATFAVNNAYDSSGNVLTTGHIILNDKVGSTYNQGDKVFAYYDTSAKKYNILSAKGGVGGGTTVTVLLTGTIPGATVSYNPLQITAFVSSGHYLFTENSGVLTISTGNTITIENHFLENVSVGSGKGAIGFAHLSSISSSTGSGSGGGGSSGSGGTSNYIINTLGCTEINGSGSWF